jgi:hypothetical protein
MNFKEYVRSLKNKYEIEEINENVIKIRKNGKELIITPDRMFDEEFLDDFFSCSISNEGDHLGNLRGHSQGFCGIGEDEDHFGSTAPSSLRMFNKGHSRGFGGIGEDDLHPKINRDHSLTGRKRQVKGMVPSPDEIFTPSQKEESDEENPFIKKDAVSPLKGKKEPDPDHFKKPGDEDDPNKFMY